MHNELQQPAINLEHFFDILKQLIRTPAVVGAERPFFMTLKRELEELNLQVEYYDGLLVAKGSNPESGYISAHADRHGLICTGQNEFQYAAFIAKNRADLLGNSNSEQLLKNFEDRFVDEKVQAYEPWSGSYLGLGKITSTSLCERRGNIIFNVEGLEHLYPGSAIGFADKLTLTNEYISAQLDNVVTVAMLVYMYHLGYQGTAFFTAEEEAGKSWRYLLDYFKRYDVQTNELLVLDTSPYKSLEMLDEIDLALRKRDENARFTSPLTTKLSKQAKKLGFSYHYKDKYLKEQMSQNSHNKTSSLGVTEMGRIIVASKRSIQGTTLQLPTTAYHTSEETAKISSVVKMLRVLQGLYIS